MSGLPDDFSGFCSGLILRNFMGSTIFSSHFPFFSLQWRRQDLMLWGTMDDRLVLVRDESPPEAEKFLRS